MGLNRGSPLSRRHKKGSVCKIWGLVTVEPSSLKPYPMHLYTPISAKQDRDQKLLERLKIRKGITHRTEKASLLTKTLNASAFEHSQCHDVLAVHSGLVVKPFSSSKRQATPVHSQRKPTVGSLYPLTPVDKYWIDGLSPIKAESLKPFLTVQSKVLTEVDSFEASTASLVTPVIKYEPIKKTWMPTVARKVVPRKPEPVSVKEAMRDREWILKAKPQVMKDFKGMLAKSNGMDLEAPSEPYFTYKYYLGPGNNAPVVKQVLGNRWWWTRVGESEKHTAHLVWTQGRDKDFLKGLESVKGQLRTVPQSQSFHLSCHIKYIDPKSTTLLNPSKVVDLSPLGYGLIWKTDSFGIVAPLCGYECSKIQTHNKLEGNYHLSNKKGLLYNLKNYYKALGKDPFEVMPRTFHLQSNEGDPEYEEFKKWYEVKGGLLILKPGEHTNRGNGISVCANLEEVRAEMASSTELAGHTYVVQQYISNPLLVHRRKFDIRCFAMVTSYNGVLQGYFYLEGYLRTASVLFSLDDISDKFIHLTNDAVQKQSSDYSKYENGNKMSYGDFQRYLDIHMPEAKVNFIAEIVPQIKNIVKDTIQASFLKLDPKKRAHTFEILGYDFLIDSNFKLWLIEVNTNPCLETSCPILARIIPAMLENSFKLAVDPLFLEPVSTRKQFGATDPLFENKYELVFHSAVDGPKLQESLQENADILELIDPAIQELSGEEELEIDQAPDLAVGQG